MKNTGNSKEGFALTSAHGLGLSKTLFGRGPVLITTFEVQNTTKKLQKTIPGVEKLLCLRWIV